MRDSFEKTIARERVSENEHRLVIPDGWQQGRAFSGDLCGPALSKETRIVSRVLRRGNNQTNVSATLEQDGAVVTPGIVRPLAPTQDRPIATVSFLAEISCDAGTLDPALPLFYRARVPAALNQQSMAMLG